MAVYRYQSFFPSSLKALRDVIKTQNDYLPLKREELRSHRRVVVEDLQDAEALCDLASSEEHGWNVEILINDDNSGNFKREVHAGTRVVISKGKYTMQA
ncbi:hypothetical protein ACFX1Q_031978 [Malus domestica]